jgi:uncharacterized protein (TIGR02996 family)
MSADADFLRAIVADTEADAPRLAYADWLDETGDAARAEFIRVQCFLAGLPAGEREYHPLARRQQELLTAHQADWLRPLRDLVESSPDGRGRRWWGRRPAANLIAASFRRGFVEYLRLDVAAFLRTADRLTQMTPLKSLGLEPVSGTEPAGTWDELAESPHLRDVTELKLRSRRLGRDEMRRLTHGESLTNLRSLGLLNPGFDRSAIDTLTRSPMLERLDALDVLAIAAADHEPCADLLLQGSACKNLEYVVVGGMSEIDAVFLQRLARTPPFQRLTRLELPGSPVGDADLGGFLDWLPPTVARLGLNYLGLGDRSAAALGRWPGLRQLRHLDLSANKITEVGALALADSPNLLASTRVDLRNNPISDRVKNALRIRMGHHVTV